ncbi:MAG: hypothetical protein OXR68_08025 [Alphaproteobacteria bacterium]|nr:hypothetical protein [Alphaproteobacteria bacterium]MDD9920552.1 hypothetical protein [Alphaproteobacteria bacterium]
MRCSQHELDHGKLIDITDVMREVLEHREIERMIKHYCLVGRIRKYIIRQIIYLLFIIY